jgi:hypothetical protein
MAKPHIEGLLTQLHEKFASSETSPQQEELLRQLRSQLVDANGPLFVEGDPVATAELLREELEEEHPHLSRAVHELIVALGNIGI